MEIQKRLREILNTFSPESQQLVFKKCEELGLNPDRGEITLREAFINLSQIANILIDSIQKNKLAQIPLSLQKSLLAQTDHIFAFQQSLLNGVDDVVNLVEAIEELYSSIWLYRLQDITDEALGFSVKMNQLKEQEVKAQELNAEIQAGLKLKTELEALFKQTSQSSEEITKLLEASRASSTKTEESEAKTLELMQKTSASVASIEQNDSSATQLLSNSKVSSAEINTLEIKIREFFSNIDSYKEEMLTTKSGATKAVEQNDEDTRKLISNLKQLEEQIKDQLQKATGHSLFHSFQTRQANLNSSKLTWIIALGVLVGISVSLTAVIAFTTEDFDTAFYLKLSMSLPLIYAIAFCSVQYTRERKLEEEYAFKSNISISLIPYKELVEKFVDSTNAKEREKFAAFIIESINKVFTSPTRRIFDKDQADVKPELMLKEMSESLATILKPFEGLFRK
jgi:hypothetical protein